MDPDQLASLVNSVDLDQLASLVNSVDPDDQDPHCFLFDARCELVVINQNMKYRIVLANTLSECPE